ncbi:hypothetical protein SAMN04487844_14012 [Methylobacterium sp. yr596]|jgi:hypothetical protein|nr:hypothetical protein SAMN04487844_14012 [Methylobacterium sp. yr596]
MLAAHGRLTPAPSGPNGIGAWNRGLPPRFGFDAREERPMSNPGPIPDQPYDPVPPTPGPDTPNPGGPEVPSEAPGERPVEIPVNDPGNSPAITPDPSPTGPANPTM